MSFIMMVGITNENIMQITLSETKFLSYELQFPNDLANIRIDWFGPDNLLIIEDEWGIDLEQMDHEQALVMVFDIESYDPLLVFQARFTDNPEFLLKKAKVVIKRV